MVPEKINAKDRILNTSLHLFSHRGYAAVGVREIANQANVNISMISYYFGGKMGILLALIDAFHDAYALFITSLNSCGRTQNFRCYFFTRSHSISPK